MPSASLSAALPKYSLVVVVLFSGCKITLLLLVCAFSIPVVVNHLEAPRSNEVSGLFLPSCGSVAIDCCC